MRFYSLPWRAVMELPLRVFWSLNAQVNRLRAEENLESLDVNLMANHGDSEGITGFRSSLREAMGTTVDAREIPTIETHRQGLRDLMKFNDETLGTSNA